MADQVVPTVDGGQDLGTDDKRWGTLKALAWQLADKVISDIRLSTETAGDSDTVLLTEKMANSLYSSVWGGITGTLANQTDLQNALDLKATVASVSSHTGDATIHFTAGSLSSTYEGVLGNPTVDGYVLSSTVAGVRSWIPDGLANSTKAAVADYTILGIVDVTLSSADTLVNPGEYYIGIQINYTATNRSEINLYENDSETNRFTVYSDVVRG